MGVSSYRDLQVWQASVDLSVECYKATKAFPQFERFGLASQIQRAAVSIPANLAEGQARFSTREFLRYVSIAYGSLAELETHVEVAKRLGYLASEQDKCLTAQMRRVGQLLNGLSRALRSR